jgi:[acyl-carrier-protein] S-malonyltransferase
VRWVESVRKMAEARVTRIVECGPGRILTGLTRRIVPQVDAFALIDAATLAKAREAVTHD